MVKPFQLNNEQIFVVAEAPGGLYNPDQLAAIASICDDQGIVVKVTEDQRLGLMITPAQFDEVNTALATVGAGLRHYQDGMHQTVSCLGSHCPLAQQDALQAAMKITEQLRSKSFDTAVKIGVNGCSNCCVPAHTLDISIIGEDNGFRVSLGGKTSQIPELASFIAEGIPAGELTQLIERAVDTMATEREPEETLQDTMQRVGTSPFVAAFAPYSQDAAGDTDPFADLQEQPSDLSDSTEDAVKDDDQFNKDPSAADLIDSIGDDLLDFKIDQDLPGGQVDISPAHDTSAAGLVDDVMIQEHTQEIIESVEGQIREPEPIEFTEEDLREPPPIPDLDETLALIDDIPSQDEEENELESKLNESIAEHAVLSELPTDDNFADRDQTLDMVAHSEPQAAEPELMDDEPTEMMTEEINLLDDESFSNSEVLDSDLEDISESPEPVTATDIARANANAIASLNFSENAMDNDDQMGDINSVSVNDEFAKLTFANGANVTIDMNWLKEHGGKRNFTVNGHQLSIRLTNDGLQVKVDGLEIQLPEFSLAA